MRMLYKNDKGYIVEDQYIESYLSNGYTCFPENGVAPSTIVTPSLDVQKRVEKIIEDGLKEIKEEVKKPVKKVAKKRVAKKRVAKKVAKKKVNDNA